MSKKKEVKKATSKDLYQDMILQLLGLVAHGAITTAAGALTYNEIAAADGKMSNIMLYALFCLFMAYRTNGSWQSTRKLIDQMHQLNQKQKLR